MRNVFSPLLSGGSLIACGGFDALLFWDTLVAHKVTWYYASPTMHHAVLNEAANRYVHCCRFICILFLDTVLIFFTVMHLRLTVTPQPLQ